MGIGRQITARAVRLLVVGAVSFGSLVAGGVAAADDYPLTTGTLTTSVEGESSTSFQPGETVRVTGGGFAPAATVTITLHSTPVTLEIVAASATGAIDTRVIVPAGTTAGRHTIKAQGPSPSDGTTLLSIPVTVEGSESAGYLAFTGADVAVIGAIGGVAVVAGTGALFAVRRSRARL